jgi:hypothetical protein
MLIFVKQTGKMSRIQIYFYIFFVQFQYSTSDPIMRVKNIGRKSYYQTYPKHQDNSEFTVCFADLD